MSDILVQPIELENTNIVELAHLRNHWTVNLIALDTQSSLF